MNIEKLYEELGREIGKPARKTVEHFDPADGLTLRERLNREHIRHAQAHLNEIRSIRRVAVLKKAIALAEEGMDPLQAKLIAHEIAGSGSGDHPESVLPPSHSWRPWR